jgi:hypothetical protein
MGEPLRAAEPLLWSCPALYSWLSESACERMRAAARKARPLSRADAPAERRNKARAAGLPCRRCPGVVALHEAGETPAPRPLRLDFLAVLK